MTGSRVIICDVCRRVLDTYTDGTGASYIHAMQDPDDHEPVPVEAPPGWRGGRCDFCNDSPPTHLLPAKDFTVPARPSEMSRGDWAACTPCAVLVELDAWGALVQRVAHCHWERHGVGMDLAAHRSVAALYGRLRKNVTGPLRPISTDEGNG